MSTIELYDRVKMMIDRVKTYFLDGLWNFRLKDEKGWRHIWVKWLRIISLSCRGFVNHKCSLSASSLTYYGVMAIVPVLSIIFAVARGIGYHEVFRTKILEQFQDQQTALNELFKYADLLLEQSKRGGVAEIGFIILLTSVIFILRSLEGILNQIWGISKKRSWKRVLSDYFSIMFIGSLLFVVSTSAAVFSVDHLESVIKESGLNSFLATPLLFFLHLTPYGLFCIFFTFIYLFIPNTKVRFSSALVAGFWSGCIYLLIQWGYIYFQIGVNRYGAVYGSMAALPLFLIWLQISWLNTLFGAEICYAHQTLDEHEFEWESKKASFQFKKVLALWIVQMSLKKGSFTLEMAVKEHQVPIALLKPIVETLVECGILNETGGGYIPDLKSVEFKISDLLEKIESHGENGFPYINPASLAPFQEALDHFRKETESSPYNKRLIHVSDPL